MRWRWFEEQWHERLDWIRLAKSAFSELIIEYEQQPIAQQEPEAASSTPPQLKRQRRRHCDDSSDSDSDSDNSLGDVKASVQQQLIAYLSDKPSKELIKSKKDSPL